MAISKTPKPTKKKRKVTNLTVDMYKDLFTLREQPISEAFVDRLSADLVEWATTNDDALVLTDFYSSRKINPGTYWNWEQKHPKLTEAKKIAMLIIGARREKGALKNQLNASMVISQQAKYDPSWWALEEKRANLKAKTMQKHDSDVTYKIVVDSYADEPDKITDNMPKE